MVIGHAREVTDPAELARLRGLLPASWAPGPREHLVCIQMPNSSLVGASATLLQAEKLA